MIERKAEVLAELLRGSWMVDAGWSPLRIAAHYQADRDWRAAVRTLRRKGIVPTSEAIRDQLNAACRLPRQALPLPPVSLPGRA